MDYRNNVFTFAKISDAQNFIDYVYQILADYKCVTLADLYDYAYYGDRNYLENKVVWTEETLTSVGNKIRPRYDSYKDWWYVRFPEPDQYPACEPTYHNTKETPTPEPLNITIITDADPLKDSYTTIREVIQQANEIKDRPIFITIN